jgi:hypothetical protein
MSSPPAQHSAIRRFDGSAPSGHRAVLVQVLDAQTGNCGVPRRYEPQLNEA